MGTLVPYPVLLYINSEQEMAIKDIFLMNNWSIQLKELSVEHIRHLREHFGRTANKQHTADEADNTENIPTQHHVDEADNRENIPTQHHVDYTDNRENIPTQCHVDEADTRENISITQHHVDDTGNRENLPTHCHVDEADNRENISTQRHVDDTDTDSRENIPTQHNVDDPDNRENIPTQHNVDNPDNRENISTHLIVEINIPNSSTHDSSLHDQDIEDEDHAADMQIEGLDEEVDDEFNFKVKMETDTENDFYEGEDVGDFSIIKVERLSDSESEQTVDLDGSSSNIESPNISLFGNNQDFEVQGDNTLMDEGQTNLVQLNAITDTVSNNTESSEGNSGTLHIKQLKSEVIDNLKQIKAILKHLPNSSCTSNLDNILFKYIQASKLFRNTVQQIDVESQNIFREMSQGASNEANPELRKVDPSACGGLSDLTQMAFTDTISIGGPKGSVSNVQLPVPVLIVSGIPVPVGGKPVPVGGIPVPVGGIPVPVEGKPVPVSGILMPAGGKPVPVGGIPAPVGGKPVSLSGISAPVSGLPVSVGGIQVPVGGIPVPVGGIFCSNVSTRSSTTVSIPSLVQNTASISKDESTNMVAPLNPAIASTLLANIAKQIETETKNESFGVNVLDNDLPTAQEDSASLSKLNLKKKTVRSLLDAARENKDEYSKSNSETDEFENGNESSDSSSIKPLSFTPFEMEDGVPVFQDDRNVMCPYCPKKFFLEKRVKEHIVNMHPEHSPWYTCFTCQTGYKNRNKLYAHRDKTGHRIIGPSPPVVCELCGKTLSSKGAYSVHLTSVHCQERNFLCEFCSQAYKNQSMLQEHKRQVHMCETCICDICNREFKNRRKMMTHRLRHTNEKKLQCEDCGKKFFDKNPLIAHMRIHSGEKPFKCSLCSYACAFKPNLAKHMKVHNKRNSLTS